MSTGYTNGRLQRAKLHHVCQSGHLILPGDSYYVGWTMPGSGSYPIGGGDYETESWDWDWGKLCLQCYHSAYDFRDVGKPLHRALLQPKYRKAFEQALRNGHQLRCDDEGAARFTCQHRVCGAALLMPCPPVVYGSAIDNICTGVSHGH